MVYWPLVKKKFFLYMRKWWHNYPELCVLWPIATTLMFTADHFYWDKMQCPDRDSSFYKIKYTVYRPDDPHVEFMRRPTEYPPYRHTTRENFYRLFADDEY
uniref:Uncharacterized protein n=1 Tax=Romanomermis culicivorax TaxID=13658 RepID=A0A915HJI0_ROMCU